MADATIDDTPLSRRFLLALVVPVALIVAAGVVLGMQLSEMAEDARWVDHSDEVIAKTYEFQKEVLDQETGFRGFLVTGDRLFLEPYLKAQPLEVLREIGGLVSDSPTQEDRVNEIGKRYALWLSETVPSLNVDSSKIARSRDEMVVRKSHMDNIREAADDMMTVERTLRHERALASQSSTRTTRVELVGLLAALSFALAFFSRRQMGEIARTFSSALAREKEARTKLLGEDWVRRGHVQLAEDVRGERTVAEVAERSLRFLATYVSADIGAFYVMEGAGWARLAGFALDSGAAGPERFSLGEGLVGQAAASKHLRRLKDVPHDYLKVRSGAGERRPVNLLLVPAIADEVPRAVVELGFLREADAQSVALLERVGETVAVAVRSAEIRARLRDLLEESQRQGEALQTQQEELQVANEELQTQSDALRQAHAQLEERKEELEVSNTSLLMQRNDLARAQHMLEEKATEVERASRYKSEFLANMSHELRTPLNSSLILAKLLAANKSENLTPEQVKFATMIHDAGNDLLALINDILDISKVEAGKIELRVTSAAPARVAQDIAQTMDPMARDKKLAFTVRVEDTAPAEIETDVQRLHQILKNLVSNGLKFTESGEVSLVVRGVADRIEFAVRDTGIGIAPDQQEVVFEAFRQADGTSNRRFGGTGLGLSISRNLARLLGGDLHVASKLGEGSTFTLVLPRVYVARATSPVRSKLPPPRAAPSPRKAVEPRAGDDRDLDGSKGRTVLVIEDDEAFARILFDLAHELDFQCLVAHSADEGVELAFARIPNAILLDVKLPDHSGLSVLDRLKRSPITRHIPVHVMSAGDFAQEALSMGATGYIAQASHAGRHHRRVPQARGPVLAPRAPRAHRGGRREAAAERRELARGGRRRDRRRSAACATRSSSSGRRRSIASSPTSPSPTGPATTCSRRWRATTRTRSHRSSSTPAGR